MEILTAKDIADYVNSQHGKDIRHKNRKSEMMRLRLIYTKLCSSLLNISLSETGREINRDHATILHYNKLLKNPFKFTNTEVRLVVRYRRSILEIYETGEIRDDDKRELFIQLDKLKESLSITKDDLRVQKALNKQISKDNSKLIEKNISLKLKMDDMKFKIILNS